MAPAGDLHIAILPTPGIGHIIPFVELARKLHQRHRISATIIIPHSGGPLSAPQKSLLAALPPAIDHILLPAADLGDLQPDVRAETRIVLTVARSLLSIRAAVESLLADPTKKLVALIVDLFGTDGFEIAREFQIPPYIFFPSTATCLSLFLHLPELHETVRCEYRDATEPFRFPGCIPINGRDLVDPLQDRTNAAYEWILHLAKSYPLAEGIILNSSPKLEPRPIQALQNTQIKNPNPKIYPIGPLTHTPSISNQISEPNNCITWLDQHPINSVLYVSFGSGGSLSHNQITEMAAGLEISQQRFLWVLRCPNDESPSAAYFNIRDSSEPLSYLPEGFLSRTKEKALVVEFWAPQVEILAHKSTGGFLTHCGWNSTLESIVHGVPMILWPLYAEQKMNAAMVAEEMKLGVRVEIGENGVVGREEVARVVKELMNGEEGKGVRSRIKDLGNNVNEESESVKVMDLLAQRLKTNCS